MVRPKLSCIVHLTYLSCSVLATVGKGFSDILVRWIR
jgi:hypothetical protein